MRPEVRARRAKLTRYVQWTVGALVVVCVVALGKLVASRGPQRLAGHAVTEVTPPASARAAPAPEVAVSPPVRPVAAEPPTAANPSGVEPVAEAAAPAPAAAEAKAAADEKKDARIALERGEFAKAIAAGERSVALDAKDGEAWLILGAAYQSIGRALDARRSFLACTKEGTRGPLGECRAMLR
jgi:Flp pilus assembly protein TadD